MVEIGIPKEIMNYENRIALTPAGVHTLTSNGHKVFVEKSAGKGAGFSDEEYVEAGAKIVDTPEEAWDKEMVMKVKEPLEEEYDYIKKDQIIFTYFHLASQPALTKVLVEKEAVAIAYETVQLEDRSLPLLTPMSEVAGYMATQIGAQFLEKTKGGKGILLSGVPGVSRGKVTIIGGGGVGTNAAKIAVGLGADVTIIDLDANRLRQLDDLFGKSVTTLMSNPYNIAESVAQSDLVIGAVLIPGSRAPKLVTEEMVKRMSPGSVIVDVAVDQGGIFETVDRVTTHDNPTYEKHGVLHYAVANMPGAVPRTSTIALTNVTVPYALQIANKGLKQAVLDNPALAKGVNTLDGCVTHEAVAKSLGYDYTPVKDALQALV